MSQKAIAAVLIGVISIVAALAVQALVPADSLTKFVASIDLAAKVIGFFLTIYGSAIVGMVAIERTRANQAITVADVAVGAVPAATGALLMVASSL